MARIYVVDYGKVFYGTKDDFEEEFAAYPCANASLEDAASGAKEMVESMNGGKYDFHAIDGELLDDDLDFDAIKNQIAEYEAAIAA